MKGIILAGGSGTRLYPLSQVASKQLLPVYDKPMIYYPLSTLMLMGIKDILIISTPQDTPKFQNLFHNGKHLGLNIQYKIQEKPEGIAQAFILGEKFIGDDGVCLILGDNIFYGHGYVTYLNNAITNKSGATIFGYWVSDPERYGVVEIDNNGNILDIVEKPKLPKSNYAIPGLYIYDNNVVEISKSLTPSARGELEISDVNKVYLNNKKLHVELLGRGIAWLDTGTHQSLLNAGTFIETIETRQGLKIGCIEEIALSEKFILESDFLNLIKTLPKNEYRKYLEEIVSR